MTGGPSVFLSLFCLLFHSHHFCLARQEGLFRDSPQRLFSHAEGASLPQSFYVHLYIFSFCYWPLTEIYSHSQQHTPKVHNVMHKRLSASLVFIGAFSKAGDCALLTLGNPSYVCRLVLTANHELVLRAR